MKSTLVKRSLPVVGLFFVLSSIALSHGNKPGTAKLEIAGGEVKVDFVGPSANGRDLMKLLPAGSYWRLGADKATTFTSSVDLMFGEKKLAKGDYKLVVHLSDDGNWSVVVADELEMPGFSPKTVIAKASAELTELESAAENMVIRLEQDGDGAKMMVDWGKSRLTASFGPA